MEYGLLLVLDGGAGFSDGGALGIRFLNTLSYLFNLLFLIVFNHQKFYRKGFILKLPFFGYKLDGTGRKALLGAIGLFVVLNIWGFYLKRRLSPTDRESQILIVQHNIGQAQNVELKKNFRSVREQAYFQLEELTYKGLLQYRKAYGTPKNIHFILWPEGAYPYIIPKNGSQIGKPSLLVRKIKVPLITGGVGRREKGYSNSLFTLSREGNLLRPVYDKNILLAFGEYMPGIFSLPFVQKFFPYFQGRFVQGTEPEVLNLEGVYLGFQICYESLFDFHGRDLAQKGAQFIVNVTNDSWYGAWQEPWQHLYMSLARAVELRRPFVRGTNTGFSTVIKEDGTVMERSPLNQEWVHLYTVPYRTKPQKTLFMSWGFYINEIFLSLLTLLGLFWFGRVKRESK